MVCLPRERMDAVFHVIEVRVERGVCGFVAQERLAVFGGDNEMNISGGMRVIQDNFVLQMQSEIGHGKRTVVG